jgi:hypothetical protein
VTSAEFLKVFDGTTYNLTAHYHRCISQALSNN